MLLSRSLYLSTTRWSLTALGVTIDLPKIVESTILCSDVPTDAPFNPDGDQNRLRQLSPKPAMT